MKKDFQLLSPNTRVRQSVSDHLELLSKRIDQGLYTSVDYITTVQPYTDRYCVNPQQRFVRGFCRLSIQAMLQKYIASLSHCGDLGEARKITYLNRFNPLLLRRWHQHDLQQVLRIQQMLEQLLHETEQWPVFIEQGCIVGHNLLQLQQAMSLGIEQTVRRLIRPKIQRVIDQLLSWNQVMQSLKRVRQRLRLNQCTDHQIHEMHRNLLRMITDTEQSFSPHNQLSNHQVVKQFMQKVDLSLWVDRLEWLSRRLDHYTRNQGVVRTALAWIAQHNRLMNIQRIISEAQVVIARMQQWRHTPDSVKQSIVQLERIVFNDLKSHENDMHVSVQMAQTLNQDTQRIESDRAVSSDC